VAADCIQRSRDTFGRVTEKILSGSNPLRFETNGKTASILYLEIQPRRRLVNLFGRIENGTLEDAPALFGRILERMGGFDVTFQGRDDTAYFATEVIPADFLLWDEEYPADLAKYRTQPVAICGMWQASRFLDCRQWANAAPERKRE
jgi:hypothetical protein